MWTFLLSVILVVLAGLGLAAGWLLSGRVLERGCPGVVARAPGGAPCPGCPQEREAGCEARR